MARDIVGETFGFLEVLFERGKTKEGYPLLGCRCICGKDVIIPRKRVITGNTKSCGCLHTKSRLKHGKAKRNQRVAEYGIWASMKQRCTNPKSTHYAYYGGRGISVCERWANSFEAFLADVGRRPSTGHSIDRVDNSGNYEPGNVRWATRSQQMKNRRKPSEVTAQDLDIWAQRFPDQETK